MAYIANGSRPGSTQGRARIGVLLLLLLLAVIAYGGIQAASAYVDYLALQDTVRLALHEIAMAPHRVDEGMEKAEDRILAKARELHLPLLEDQVVLTTEEETIRARVRWEQPIGLWRFTFPLPFEIEESKSLRGAM